MSSTAPGGLSRPGQKLIGGGPGVGCRRASRIPLHSVLASCGGQRHYRRGGWVEAQLHLRSGD